MATLYKKINFMQWNTDFSKAATYLIEKFMNDYGTDAAFIQDIYCGKFGLDQSFKPPDFKGYNMLYYKEEAMPKVALYVKTNIKTTFLPQASNSHCITCIVHLENSKSIILSSVYCPPPDISPLLRTESLFNNLSALQIQNLLLCGDFNSHSTLWSNQSKNDKKGDDLEALLLQNDLTVLNDVDSPPTFENTRGGVSWIDISAAGNKIADKCGNWKVINEECLSFHKIITFSLSVSPLTSHEIRYNFEKTNWLRFNNILEDEFLKNNITTDNLFNGSKCEVDDLAKRITISIRDTIVSVVPSSVNYKNRTLVSWWSKDISDLRKQVNKARAQKQKYRSTENIQLYKNARNNYKYAIRKSKHEDFSKYCSSADSPWDLLRKLTSKPQCTATPTLLKDDGTFSKNDSDTCEYLLKKWFPDDDQATDDVIHGEIRHYVSSYLNQPFIALPKINDAELETINTIAPLKAPGWDLIRAIVLQNLSFQNQLIIKYLFNLCIKFSIFPSVWKFGMGKTLPKPDKTDESNYKSYRCITLLSVLGKWFEKIIMKRLIWTALQNNLLSPKQYGFIPGRSCEDALCNITLLIETAFSQNKFVLIIFLDISGAFDCTWHPSILKSFINKGYQPAYIHLIKSYLSNRLVQLKLNDSHSQKHLTRSCPQGGGISPFIWDTDFDDTLDVPTVDPEVLSIIEDCVHVDSDSQAFADDSQVAIISESLLSCQLIANDILTKLYEHSKLKKSNYSAEKTKAVIFAKRKIPFPIDIRLNNQQISISENAKLLGVTLNTRLAWKPHVDEQVTKCKRLLFLLNKCCKLKWGLKGKAFRQIWTGVLEHILLYGSPAWASCISKKWLHQKLESVQRLAAIKIIKAFKSVSYEASIALSGLTPIVSRLQEKCLVYAAKHPDHYKNNHNFTSHVSTVNQLAEQYDLDLFNYQIPNKSPAQISPSERIPMSNSIRSIEEYPLRKNGFINIYTDGSKSSSGTGCAFVMFPPAPLPLYQEQLKLNPDNSVYQAELIAVLLSLQHLMSLPFLLFSTCSINIFTDSQSQINEISNIDTDNFIVREIHKYLQFYNTISNVSIFWCKGHSNILGNEVADYFARQSVLSDKQNDKFKRPLSHLKFAFKKITEHCWTERWQNSDKARNTFSFIPRLPAPKHFTQKEHHHKLTQILTGHCRLKMYLNYIGVEPDPACSCGEYVETVDHYIFYCKLEHTNRTNTLIKSCFEQGIAYPPSREILFNNNYLFYSLCSFLTSSSRLDFDK